MRHFALLAAAATLALAGCSSSEEAKKDDAKTTSGSVATEGPRAGQYDTTVQIVEFDVPGMPDNIKQQMMAQGAQKQSQCITEEQAKKGGWKNAATEIGKGMQKSGGKCETLSDKSSAGALDITMKCTPQGGGSMEMTIAGTATSDGYNANLSVKGTEPSMAGEMKMRMTIDAKRTGDCTAAK